MDVGDRPLALTGHPSKVMAYGFLRRERWLPSPGEIRVRPGQRVEPSEVIGETSLPEEVRILHLAEGLSISEEALPQHLLKRVGEVVEKGEVIATVGKRGPFRRAYRAPAGGKIISCAHGRLLLELSTSVFELRAHLKGVVAEVFPRRGVAIKASGASVEGAWGNHKEASGVLKLLGREKILLPEAIDMGHYGTILIVGGWATEEGLRKALEVEVRGVILGSLDSSLGELISSLPFPVVITEGFGELLMAQPIFSLFQRHVGREASIASDSYPGVQRKVPQVMITFLQEEAPTLKEPPLEEGSLVRLLREPYLGQVGRVRSPSPLTARLENGLEVEGVEVISEEGETVFAPLVNLEPLNLPL